MKNQWPIWVLIIGIIIVVLFAFNYHGEKEFVPLSEIFPDEKVEKMPDIKYEFVNETAGEAPAPAASATTGSVETTPAVSVTPSTVSVTPPVVTSKPGSATSPVVTTSVGEVKDLSRVPFTIQVASSNNKASAEKILQAVKAKGYPAYLVEKNLGAKGIWYRTYVGTFQTKKEADDYLLKVRQHYKDSFIITPK
jgi:cell division septation protein DedD